MQSYSSILANNTLPYRAIPLSSVLRDFELLAQESQKIRQSNANCLTRPITKRQKLKNERIVQIIDAMKEYGSPCSWRKVCELIGENPKSDFIRHIVSGLVSDRKLRKIGSNNKTIYELI